MNKRKGFFRLTLVLSLLFGGFLCLFFHREFLGGELTASTLDSLPFG
jgi:hypothetical protein